MTLTSTDLDSLKIMAGLLWKIDVISKRFFIENAPVELYDFYRMLPYTL